MKEHSLAPLIKDATTGKKSVTITGLVISGILMISCQVLVLLGKLESSAIGWFWLPTGTFAAIYLNKRVRLNTDSVEFLGEK